MNVYDKLVEISGSLNLALACAFGLGYFKVSVEWQFWLHFLLWPSLFFAAVLMVLLVWEGIKIIARGSSREAR